jgi:hypothetical protein
MLKLKVAPNLFVGAPQWWDELMQRNKEIFDGSGWSQFAGLDRLRHFRNLFICQPYHIEGEPLAKLLDVCRAEGLIVKLSGVSNYYPSNTLSLIIFRPVDEQDYRAFILRIRTSEIVVPFGKDLFDGVRQ